MSVRRNGDFYEDDDCRRILLYWGACYLGTGTDKKNLMGLRSYPEEVQSLVRKDAQLAKDVPKEKSIAAILLGNLLLFTIVFSVWGVVIFVCHRQNFGI